MKICLLVFVVLLFGMLGFVLKSKYIKKCDMLKFVYEFENYYSSNLSLFKNNVVEIIDNYIIMQKNKNENFCKIFRKNHNIYSIDEDFLKKYISDANITQTLKSFLQDIGKNEYDYEKEKNKNIREYLKQQIEIAESDINKKGSLLLKLLLSVGAVVAILLW